MNIDHVNCSRLLVSIVDNDVGKKYGTRRVACDMLIETGYAETATSFVMLTSVLYHSVRILWYILRNR